MKEEFSMGLPGDVEIKLVIREKQIAGVEGVSGYVEVTPLTPLERKEFEGCPYGLRPVDTLFETQIAQSATKCYMIIGGFKVQVPCS